MVETVVQPLDKAKVDAKLVHELREKAKRSLFFFSKGILGFDWLNGRIHKPICRLLEDPKVRNLKIVMPRGWQKSTLISVCYPLWRAINNPNVRILLAQNTQTNANKKLAKIASIVLQNDLFRALFPEILPGTQETWRTDSLCLKREVFEAESTFESAGTQAKITSRHYDEVIEDDTVSPDLDDLSASNVVPSKEDIEKAIGWHRMVTPIIQGMPNARNIVVGTRWAERDLLSYIDEHEGGFFVSYERAVRETNGKPDPQGEVMFPERFPAETLTEIEARLGPYLYSCNYLNMPIRTGDMIFKEEWLQEYEKEPRDLAIYTTVDIANDPKEMLENDDPDYCVVLTTGKSLTTGRIYVLDYTRERLNPSQLVSAIFTHVKRWSPLRIGVMAIQFEKSIKHWCEERMRKENTYFVVDILKSGNKAKELRIMGLQPIYSARSIYHRGWMVELRSELLSFPRGRHDDIIDTLSMQTQMWALTRSERIAVEGEKDGVFDSFESAARELRREREESNRELIFADLAIRRQSESPNDFWRN